MQRGASRRATPWLAFAVIAAIVLVCVGAVVGARRLVEERLLEDARFRLELASDLAEVAEYESLRRLTAAAVTLSRDTRLVDAIQRGDRAALDAAARTVQDSTDGAKVAFVVAPDSRVLGMHPVDESVIGQRFTDRDWFRGVQRTSPYLSEVYEMRAFDRARAVSVAAEVLDPETGARVGIVSVAVEADFIGRALSRSSRLEGAPSLLLRDQGGAVISSTERDFGSGPSLRERRSVRGTDWTIEARISEQRALAELPGFRRATTVFAALVCTLLFVLAILLYVAARRLDAARRDAERQEQAFQLNDSVVQRMAVAHLALAMGQQEQAARELEAALDAGRRMIGQLADGRVNYVRDVAAGADGAVDDPAEGARA